MTVVGRMTAQHRIKEPRLLKYVYDAAAREKYRIDIRHLATEWAAAIKNGDTGRFRVFLEIDYKAALYVYDWGKKYRVCSVDMMAAPEIVMQLHKGV